MLKIVLILSSIFILVHSRSLSSKTTLNNESIKEIAKLLGKSIISGKFSVHLNSEDSSEFSVNVSGVKTLENQDDAILSSNDIMNGIGNGNGHNGNNGNNNGNVVIQIFNGPSTENIQTTIAPTTAPTTAPPTDWPPWTTVPLPSLTPTTVPPTNWSPATEPPGSKDV